MRVLAAVLLLSLTGCSLLLGDDPSDAADAGVDAAASVTDAGPGDAGQINTDDFTKPYTCDPDTLALYRFDDESELGRDACQRSIDLPGTSTATEVHPEFGRAASITSAMSVRQSAEVDDATPLADSLTVEAWVRPSRLPQGAEDLYIVTSNQDDATAAGERRFSVMLREENGQWIVRAEIADGACDELTIVESSPLPDLEWHHIAVTASAPPGVMLDPAIHIDGTLATTFQNPRMGLCRVLDPSHVMIGGMVGGVMQSFSHAIDEVRLSRVIRQEPP